MIPDNITKQDIINAILEIEEKGIRGGRHSSTYDLIYKGKAYPPKLVISIANLYRNGVELNPSEFEGGKETPAFELLKKEGFEISEKNNSNNLKIINEFVSKIKAGEIKAADSIKNLISSSNFSERLLNVDKFFFKNKLQKINEKNYVETVDFIKEIHSINGNYNDFNIWSAAKNHLLKYNPELIPQHEELNKTLGFADNQNGIYKSFLGEKNLIAYINNKFNKSIFEKKYWIYAPGENAIKWEEFYNSGIMALGWDEIGDLNQFKTRDEIRTSLLNAYGGDGSKMNDVSANDDFKNKVNIGDIVIVKKGLSELIGYGEVTSDYFFDISRNDHRSCRKVYWKLKGNWKVEHRLVLKTFTDITKYSSDSPEYDTYYNQLLGIMLDKPNGTSKETLKNMEFNKNSNFDIKLFQNKLNDSGLIFSPQLIQRFVASLCTKPFVICSGLSGSGKTKLAQAFAQWITLNESQYLIVPVGADWTNREPLLGYPNALNKEEYVSPENGVLDLMIRAKQNIENELETTKPYFLILDEMNLSHVERYFADFLSTMESGDSIPLHNIKSKTGEVPIYVPQSISLPKNLFIIGTVNIDETTYMFSPKVLDRANTIEFRLTETDLENFIASDKKLDMDLLKAQGANMSEKFMEMALIKTDKNLKPSEADLKLFFSELKKSGAEFGYRTASEIGRLMYMLKELDKSSDNLLDIAIMQKLLPKLHGSRNKLTKVLPVLGGFCLADNSKIKEDYLDKFVNNSFTDAELKADANIKYKISFEKICRMYKNAVENGFASYAEA